MKSQEQSARQRIERCREQQLLTLASIQKGVPRRAEPNVRRAMKRIEAEARSGQITSVSDAYSAEVDVAGPERVWGPTADFVGVAFLERGLNAARPVGRVAYRDSRPQGTGFLIAPGLFITNNHVLESQGQSKSFVVEFDYENDSTGRQREVSRYAFAPDQFFITDDRDDLDYTVIATGARLDGPLAIEEFGYNALSGADDKHSLGEVANIVQHPDGRLKEVVLRENRLVSRLSHVLHYVADTQPGSSGSPVFNNQWQAIALHHWGGPWRQQAGPDGMPVPRYVNEGIRVSAIVEELHARLGELSAEQQRRLRDALDLGERTGGVPKSRRDVPQPSDQGVVQVGPDGTAIWRLPIEITIGLPGMSSSQQLPPELPVLRPTSQSEAFRRVVDKTYENRRGYRERFLPGHPVPLPEMSPTIAARAADNRNAEPGDDQHELPYQHFSVYVDGTRGLPLMTACNIDGRNLKSINRTTGRVTRSESLDQDPMPESREKWFDDPRIDPALCGNDDLYTSQIVSPGRNRLGRIFHRGHMVRRLDPCWGRDRNALRAEADTFHFTNCTPQVGQFNSGRTLWQGIENHVLDNAKSDDLRVSVFTGPVLDDDNDPEYRQDIFDGFRVPLVFWKIAVWVDGGDLMALALLADQSSLLQEVPERAEDLGDTDKVEDFIGTVMEVERLTGLDFGKAVRNADLFEEVDGEGAENLGLIRIGSFSDVPLRRRPRRRLSRKRTGKRIAKKKRAKKRSTRARAKKI